MTVMTDLNAIALTATAKSAVSAKGADIGNLVANAKTHVIELQFVLKQIVAHHPSSGPDAANYAALQTIIAELA
jgi:hypothetical protein